MNRPGRDRRADREGSPPPKHTRARSHGHFHTQTALSPAVLSLPSLWEGKPAHSSALFLPLASRRGREGKTQSLSEPVGGADAGSL